jgi:hypothetical protein
MLTVNHFEIIRRKVLLDGLSQRDVARELGHSRKTIAKALVHASPPGYQMEAQRKCPVMDAYRPLIEQWLECHLALQTQPLDVRDDRVQNQPALRGFIYLIGSVGCNFLLSY